MAATIPEPAGFDNLPKLEQIRYLQTLWDRISETPGHVPARESHLNLAQERLAEHRQDPSRVRPARGVVDRLRQRMRDQEGGVVNLTERITVDPEQCGGRPCVRGTRIRVTDVLDLLASGLTAEQVLLKLPDLEPEDIRACLHFASRRV